MMIVSKPTESGTRYVFDNMRDFNYREFAEVSWTDKPPEHLIDMALSHPFMFLLWNVEGNVREPVCVIGGVETHPGHWSMLMFATDDVSQIKFQLARFCKNVMMRKLFEAGANRIQSMSPAWATDAHRWLETVGLKKESTVPQYGKTGNDFFRFARTRGDYVS